jgi:hypothetical protein
MQVIMFENFTFTNVCFYEIILMGKSINMYCTKVSYRPISEVSIYTHEHSRTQTSTQCYKIKLQDRIGFKKTTFKIERIF